MIAKNSALRSPWVIAWITTLLVVLAANIVMIYLAVDANPGLVVEDYYERGQDYEKHMTARMQRDPGWKMRVAMPSEPALATPTNVHFYVNDKEGNPVEGDSVTFYAYRPSDAKADFAVPMTMLEPGHYQAEVAFPLKGVWDSLVSIQKEGDEYNQAKRLIVAPGQ